MTYTTVLDYHVSDVSRQKQETPLSPTWRVCANAVACLTS